MVVVPAGPKGPGVSGCLSEKGEGFRSRTCSFLDGTHRTCYWPGPKISSRWTGDRMLLGTTLPKPAVPYSHLYW